MIWALRKIEVQPGYCLLLAALLLLVPLPWAAGWFLATACHEFGHYLMLRLLHVPTHRICIAVSGIRMETGPMDSCQEGLAALAGPLCGSMLMLLARWVPEAAVCAFVQSIYNLLPLYPLDGGRILRCIAASVFVPENARRLCTIVGWMVRIFVAAGILWCVLCLRWGWAPLIWGGILLFSKEAAKFPCNEGKVGVQ